MGYDEQSKLTRVIDAARGEHTFVHDEARNLVAKQDANGSLTTYAYDAVNRRTGEVQHLDAHARLSAYSRSLPADKGVPDPVAGAGVLTWSFTYDGNGNMRTMTDPRTGPGAAEETVRHEYGVLDRLAKTTWKGFAYPRELPSLTSVAYAYTGNGQLLTATETKETAVGPVDEVTARSYDGLERPETETRYDGKVLAFGHDRKGNRTLVRDPDGMETSYGYDAQDRFTAASSGNLCGRSCTRVSESTDTGDPRPPGSSLQLARRWRPEPYRRRPRVNPSAPSRS